MPMPTSPEAAMRSTRTKRRPPARGLSLLEVLFAAFLVATVAVFLAPLFVRAVASNIEGNEASLAMNFGKSFIEQSVAVDFNSPDLGVRSTDPAFAGTVRRALSMVYDTGLHDRLGTRETELGDEAWRPRTTADETAKDVRLLWDFDLDLREFSYADISHGFVSSTIFTDPGDPTKPLVLAPLPGDPDVFDSPLDATAASQFRHIKELTARLVSRRDGGILGASDRTAARHLRAY